MSKTVYLLGAGASAASEYELPITDKLLDEFYLNSDKLKGFIEQYFPNKAVNEVNIEDLITFIELSSDRFSLFGEELRFDIFHMKNEIDLYIKKRLSDPIVSRKYCKKFSQIFSDFKNENCENSIITLNYDLVVDKTLAHIIESQNKVGHSHILQRMSSFLREGSYFDYTPFSIKYASYYLKLHGSLDWYYCPNERCKNYQYLFANALIGDAVKHNITENDLCQMCGSRASMVLVPPNINKSFHRFPKLGAIWSFAHRELQKADSLVIIGVSFRETDYYLKWLLKSALLKNNSHSKKHVIVVDKNENIQGRVKDIVGNAPKYDFFLSLDAYLDSIKKL